MGVLKRLGVEPLVNVFFVFYKPIGKADEWMNFKTRASRPRLVLGLSSNVKHWHNMFFRVVPRRGQPEAGMVESTSKCTPGLWLSGQQNYDAKKKAREMLSQEHWEESVRGTPKAGMEEATNQSTLCEGWSLMGELSLIQKFVDEEAFIHKSAFANLIAKGLLPFWRPLLSIGLAAKYNRLKVVVKQMKNKTCKMVSNCEQLTKDLDAAVIRSKKFELERDSALPECKKLELE
ncbi:uncharacterized protein G2W53_026855 [Senna tora]|uniref:Uncharacterized protein n=1 Tax=Senna tora TaxID=362788 RepID=A0A834TGF2_9FABA|nr:uncharacterized protein G2W53_026855 [Senna tora]